MSAAEVLKSCPLFKDFTATGLQILAGIAQERAFPAGAPLFAEAMLAESMFVIAQGKVRLAARNTDGAEVLLAEVSAGAHLGEVALLSPGQRLCSATAITKVVALELRSADFQKLLLQKPQACMKLLLAVVGQLSRTVQENREALRSLLPRNQG
jgi:CRP/FNR family transcriptional regulator, cyclic AMP receptor protein